MSMGIGKKVFIMLKLGLYKRVFILTLWVIKFQKYPWTITHNLSFAHNNRNTSLNDKCCRSALLHSGICPFFFICLLLKYEPHTTTRLDKGAMPTLKILRIEGCNSLKVVLKGLMYVTTLQVLEIRYMSEELVERLQVLNGKDGEDFYKV